MATLLAAHKTTAVVALSQPPGPQQQKPVTEFCIGLQQVQDIGFTEFQGCAS